MVVGVLVIIAMIAVIIGIVGRKVINIAGGGNGGSSRSDMTLDELYADLDVSEATPVRVRSLWTLRICMRSCLR